MRRRAYTRNDRQRKDRTEEGTRRVERRKVGEKTYGTEKRRRSSEGRQEKLGQRGREGRGGNLYSVLRRGGYEIRREKGGRETRAREID